CYHRQPECVGVQACQVPFALSVPPEQHESRFPYGISNNVKMVPSPVIQDSVCKHYTTQIAIIKNFWGLCAEGARAITRIGRKTPQSSWPNG
ncbi:MAG TPA: hypothetical protein VM223_16750, partial [Planctomycetota bacterium]|nr:hypothetical protein [Planctomycetota bacterium]